MIDILMILMSLWFVFCIIKLKRRPDKFSKTSSTVLLISLIILWLVRFYKEFSL